MKKIVLTVIALILASLAFSQQINSNGKKGKKMHESINGYGGPMFSYTQINAAHGYLLGGKGGVVFNKKFAVGGIGMGTVGKPEFTGRSIFAGTIVQLQSNMGVGGVFLEYIVNPDCPVIFSIPVNILAGGISLNEVGTNEKVESSGLFLIEPGINISLLVNENFQPTINVSYRRSLGSDLINLKNKDISGVNIGVILKFGYFKQ